MLQTYCKIIVFQNKLSTHSDVISSKFKWGGVEHVNYNNINVLENSSFLSYNTLLK